MFGRGYFASVSVDDHQLTIVSPWVPFPVTSRGPRLRDVGTLAARDFVRHDPACWVGVGDLHAQQRCRQAVRELHVPGDVELVSASSGKPRSDISPHCLATVRKCSRAVRDDPDQVGA